jgi:23S rRNA U2552 (ribose-2'-O)-methylase RlmE/FtsJ
MSLKDIMLNDLTMHSIKWNPYFDIYEKYFSKFVGKAPVIVEIGVHGGGSLQLWRKYFGPDAIVIGIDINSNVLNYSYDENTHVIIGDQGNPQFWDEFVKQFPKIDIVVDDGSHIGKHQITTFEKLFPFVSEGGIYLCEDTHTSWYYDTHNSYEDSFIRYTKDLIDVMHKNHMKETPRLIDLSDLCSNIRSINFSDSIVVFEKEKPIEFYLIDVPNR